MTTFNEIQNNRNIQDLIKETFDAELPLSGNWGYSIDQPTIIEALPEGMPLNQLQHMIGTIRAHLEMNITQEKENRYGGININERSREENKSKESVLNKITYEVTAIKEDLYTAFIKEYKENYGKGDFDLNTHFKRRQEVTLTREVVHYFEVSSTL